MNTATATQGTPLTEGHAGAALLAAAARPGRRTASLLPPPVRETLQLAALRHFLSGEVQPRDQKVAPVRPLSPVCASHQGRTEGN